MIDLFMIYWGISMMAMSFMAGALCATSKERDKE